MKTGPEFSPRERVVVNTFLDPSVASEFPTTIWPYLFWILLSLLFLVLFLNGTNRNPALLISAYIALLLPVLLSMATVRRHYKILSDIFLKYEAKLEALQRGGGEADESTKNT